MADGKGCKCAAYSESECACDADWTPRELIDARAEIERLRQERAEMLAAGDRLEGQLFSVAKQWHALRLTDAERTTLQHYAQNNTHQRGDVLRGLLERLGGCPPQLDCGADRKSVASQRCRDTGGQPFDSAPTTTLTDAEREAVEFCIASSERDVRIDIVASARAALGRLGGER